MAKKEFDLHNFLIGKLRSASRKVPVFNEAKKRAKVAVRVEYNEGDDFVTVFPLEGPALEPFRVKIYKKAQNRERVMFRCAECGRLFFDYEMLPNKKGQLKRTSIVSVDHIIPVVGEEGFVDWNTYIKRMFEMGINGLQVLCGYPGERDGVISCHREKTNKENANRPRKERKKRAKKS